MRTVSCSCHAITQQQQHIPRCAFSCHYWLCTVPGYFFDLFFKSMPKIVIFLLRQLIVTHRFVYENLHSPCNTHTVPNTPLKMPLKGAVHPNYENRFSHLQWCLACREVWFYLLKFYEICLWDIYLYDITMEMKGNSCAALTTLTLTTVTETTVIFPCFKGAVCRI